MVITTTPKPTKLVKELVLRKDVLVTRGSTQENRANLPAVTLKNLEDKYAGTRLGRQELDAEILEDVQGALWRRSMIEELRVDKVPCSIIRTVVAIDPAVSTNERSNETGIIVACKGENGHFYVMADRSGVHTPDQWGREAVAQYRFHSADRVIGEINQGGDMVENNLRVIDPNIAYKGVRASKGKYTRAEPVSALYEKLRVHHVGTFAKLEDQMCGFVPDVDRKNEGSPDRVDALVWAMTELAVLGFPGSGILEYYADKDKRAAAAKPAPVRVRPKSS
jgi:phage terminase large subunit-like protein